MSIQYIVAGGRIEIDKNAYVKEMLSSDGVLKKMLIAANDNKIEDRPKITKNDLTKTVTINFNGSKGIDLGENYRELLQNLKAKFEDKIKGRVIVSISYFSIMYVTINLD